MHYYLCFAHLLQIADHFEACSEQAASWALLDRSALDGIARHLAARHARLMEVLVEVARARTTSFEHCVEGSQHSTDGSDEED